MQKAEFVRLIDISSRLARAMPRNTLVEELRVLVDSLSTPSTMSTRPVDRPPGVDKPVDRPVDIARAAVDAVDKRKAAQREWVRQKRAAAKARSDAG